jgi:hemerythrin superfamily protein
VSDHSDDHDVIDVLTTDHREAMELLDQIAATSEPEARRDLADSLIAELVRHSVAEEMYVYPAMRDHVPGGDAAVEHDTHEHKELESRLQRLEGADAAGADFMVICGEIRTTLEDHVRDEENEQFPKLRGHVSDELLVELKGKVETAKKIAPTRPHPSAPNAELFHKMVGPGVGLVDRLRDKLTGRST